MGAVVAGEENPVLALAYVKAYPAAAARLLERQEPGQTAQLLTQLPVRQLDELMAQLLPFYLTQVCLHLKPQRIASLLREADASYIAAVLRNLPAKLQSSVLGHLPATRRAATLLLLNFNDNEVGSRMAPRVVALAADTDIESARDSIRKGESLAQSDRLFVVDRQRHLVGHVSHLELTRARKQDDFRKLIHRSDVALLSRMSFQAAYNHPAWAQTDIMPVVNRNQQFVGAIRHVDLRSALEQQGREVEAGSSDSPLAGLAAAYGNTFLTLFNTLESIFTDSDEQEPRR